MQQNKISEIIVKTLETFSKPLTLKELYEKLIYKAELGKVVKDDFQSALKQMIQNQEILISDEFLVLSDWNIEESIINRKEVDAILRERARKLKAALKRYENSKHIKFVGISGSLDSKESASQLYVITKTDSVWIARALIMLALKFNAELSDYKIDFIIEDTSIDFDLITDEDIIKLGIEILDVNPIINNEGTYERVISRNMRIFDYFPDYPLERVSFNFGVRKSGNSEKEISRGWGNKLLMKLQSKKVVRMAKNLGETVDMSISHIKTSIKT